MSLRAKYCRVCSTAMNILKAIQIVMATKITIVLQFLVIEGVFSYPIGKGKYEIVIKSNKYEHNVAYNKYEINYTTAHLKYSYVTYIHR